MNITNKESDSSIFKGFAGKVENEGNCEVKRYITNKRLVTDVKAGDYVKSLDVETGKLVDRKVNALLDMGNKTIFSMATADGRSINTTGNHPYLVKLYSKEECDRFADSVWNKDDNAVDWNGEYCLRWVEVKYLTEGMEIGVVDKEKIKIKSYVGLLFAFGLLVFGAKRFWGVKDE